MLLVHRAMKELTKGPIPPAMSREIPAVHGTASSLPTGRRRRLAVVPTRVVYRK